MIVKGWHHRGHQPMPYGTLAVLRSQCCVGLSGARATVLYHTMPAASRTSQQGLGVGLLPAGSLKAINAAWYMIFGHIEPIFTA